jgi:hypothetical protein
MKRSAFLKVLPICLVVGLAASCDLIAHDGKGKAHKNPPANNGETGHDGDATAKNGGLDPNMKTADSDLTRRMFKAAATCGPQNLLTVPREWQFVPFGRQGCYLRAPAAWTVQNSGGDWLGLQSDANSTSGHFLMVGTMQVQVDCTPKGLRDFVLNGFAERGCTPMNIDWWYETIDPTSPLTGYAMPEGNSVFSCTKNGTKEAGYFKATIFSDLCSVLVSSFWMPEAQIEKNMCTSTQIFNSYKCPTADGGGSCTEDGCKIQCGGPGHCDAADNCVCD